MCSLLLPLVFVGEYFMLAGGAISLLLAVELALSLVLKETSAK